jgi:hypothetical protein
LRPRHFTTASNAFEASLGQQDSAVGSRIAKNAELGDKMKQMIALKSTITHMVQTSAPATPAP